MTSTAYLERHGGPIATGPPCKMIGASTPSGSARLGRDVDDKLPCLLAEHGLEAGVAPHAQGVCANSSNETRTNGGLG